MSPLSDEYLSSLEAESLRYDVTIFDDFVISVLPNGIKTWAFLYNYDGRKRRKTLGVYPDMSYEDAEDALDNARNMILKLGDDIKDLPVEADTLTVEIPKEAMIATPPPAPTPAPMPTPPPAPAPVEAAPESRPAVLATRKRKRYHTKPRRFLSSGMRYFALGLLCVLVLSAAIVVLPRLGGGGTTSAAPATERGEGRAVPKPIVVAPTAAPTSPDRAPPKPIVIDDEPAPTQVPEPVAATTTPEPEPVERGEPQPVAVATAEPVTPERVAAATTPPPVSAPPTSAQTSATSTGGNVTRTVVTSNIKDLEPVDNLGKNVNLNDGGYQTVFFFSELRNFTAGQIVHRWIHNGRVIADVPLRVDGGWRWRTYSSKDLLPGMTGDWTVAVVDGDGRVMGEQTFRFDP